MFILRILISVALFSFTATMASAGTVSFQGNFGQDDAVQLFVFTVSGPSTVTLQTWSFAGGTNGAGTVIPDGGFNPVLSLFDPAGQFMMSDSGGPPCGARNSDPATGFCWDAYLSPLLDAGVYTLALTEWDNTANGPNLTDGFSKDGQGNFTGPEFAGAPGSFLLPSLNQRTNAWALDVTGADSAAPLPEPSPCLLLFPALAGILFRARRRRA